MIVRSNNSLENVFFWLFARHLIADNSQIIRHGTLSGVGGCESRCSHGLPHERTSNAASTPAAYVRPTKLHYKNRLSAVWRICIPGAQFVRAETKERDACI